MSLLANLTYYQQRWPPSSSYPMQTLFAPSSKIKQMDHQMCLNLVLLPFFKLQT